MAGPPLKGKANEIWIGYWDDPHEVGWFQVEGVMAPSELAIFDRKVVHGDPQADSDLYISSYVIDNLIGGGQVEEANVSIHMDRFWIAMATTRWAKQTALPALVHITRPDWAPDDVPAYALGDVYRTTTGRLGGFYAAFGTHVGGWNETSDVWYDEAATQLDSEPVGEGCLFRGRGNWALLFIPRGEDGYSTVRETSAGTATVTNHTAATDVPGAVDFCVWDNKLYALAPDGQLWVNLTGAEPDWKKVKDQVSENLQLDPAREPRKMIQGVNKMGDPTLYIITDMDVWAYDSGGKVLVLTNMNEMDHPDFGLDVIQWRAGEDIWIAYGLDVLRYTTSGVPVPHTGLSRDHGLPARLRGSIVSFAKTNESLWAMVAGDVAPLSEEVTSDMGAGDDQIYFPNGGAYASIHEWSGSGWSGVWTSQAGDVVPSWMVTSRVREGRRVWWGMSDGQMRNFRISAPFQPPGQRFESGTGEWAETGYVESCRFDAGMSAFQKIFTDVTVDMRYASGTEKFEFYYRTNLDMLSSGLDPGYPHYMGAAIQPDRTFFSLNQTADGYSEGVVCNWIQYLMRIRRRTTGANPEKYTPIMRSMVNHFIKRPQNVTAYSWRIVLPPHAFRKENAAQKLAHLNKLLQADRLPVLVHRGVAHRGYISGISGQDALGPDPEGRRTIAFLQIPPKSLQNAT